MKFNRKKYSDDTLKELYEGILFSRLIEEKMLILLRQNKISKWFSGIGQEAIAVGITQALQPDEYILPMHRNLGVFTGRKIPFGRTPKVEGRTGVPAAHLVAQLTLAAVWTFAALSDALHGRWATAVFGAANIGLLLYGIWRFIGPRAFIEDLVAGLAPRLGGAEGYSRAGGLTTEG